MRKKILLSLGAVLAVVAGVAAMSAFEAHVINVTATIENALSVPVEHIAFGTVFPQEYFEYPLAITLSESFIAEGRVDDVEYVIKQKSKPKPITPPAIDGEVSGGEWDEAESIPVASGMGTVSVMADTNYMYVLFDLVDSNDARTSYSGEVGNDQISININPTDGGPWGFPYDLIFETSALSAEDGGHHILPWNPKVNSGTSDGWATRWFPNNAQETLPGDLESATTYSSGKRVTEWKLPLSSMGPEAGDELKVGGAVDVGDGNSYVYPIGLNWSVISTFYSLELPVYPDLCAYLSKTPDDKPANDTGVPAFHEPSAVAYGYLSKFIGDTVDDWIIDLVVPCFEGMCAQDWTHQGWELPAELESETFGCDLWIEVTGISK